jgi:hypothetical protein
MRPSNDQRITELQRLVTDQHRHLMACARVLARHDLMAEMNRENAQMIAEEIGVRVALDSATLPAMREGK